MKKPKHVHKFLPFSTSFLMCSCGQFRATEAHLKDHPPIVEIPALTRTDEQVRADIKRNVAKLAAKKTRCTACGAVAGRKHHDPAYRQITVRLEQFGCHAFCQPCLEGVKQLAAGEGG